MTTILVVDDSRVSREVTKIHLAPTGATIVEAADGVEGVRLALEIRPDLVITDSRMPGLSGAEVCATLHSEGIPVIVLSSESEAVAAQCKANGALAALHKPTNCATLAAVILPILGLRRAS
jgi:CheY-like chemotaxis protein